MKIVACAMAIMLMSGMPISFGVMAGFIFMLGIAMVAAPGGTGRCDHGGFGGYCSPCWDLTRRLRG